MGYVPLAALAAMLLVVAWNVSEHRALPAVAARARGQDAVVMLATFALTLARRPDGARSSSGVGLGLRLTLDLAVATLNR